ncbi:MAG: hypothetical protein WBV82_30195 [Myxococcaceae bacterium]
MNSTRSLLLSAVLLCLSAPSAFAQTAGETVSLGLVSSSQCGTGGAEVRRLDRGPEGAYSPSYAPYVVPAGFLLEVTDLQYEVAGLSGPGAPAVLSLWTRDRATGLTNDGIWHKHAYDQHYEAGDDGAYRLEYRISARWSTYHVQLQSGLQVSSRSRLCVTVQSPRFQNLSFRARLVSAPSSGSTVGGSTVGGGVIGGVFKSP